MLLDSNFPITLANNTLALTYDDGPGPWTLEIAKFLHGQGIRATFFAVGMHVRANREIVRKVRELQHWIGNHTETHETLTNLESTPDELIREVIEAHHRIQEFIGEGPFLFRSPGGAWSSKVADVLNGCDDLRKYAGPIGWNIDCADYDIGSRQTFEECRGRYLQSIQKRRSGVVLLHDWCANPGEFGDRLRSNNRTLELTKWLVPQLADFKFVALDEVIPSQLI